MERAGLERESEEEKKEEEKPPPPPAMREPEKNQPIKL